MVRQTLTALAIASLLAGCNADGTPRQNTAAGAAIGALAGAGVGALIGKRRGALIGAGVGAIAGAGVGSYLDEQKRRLDDDLAGTGATVENTGTQPLNNDPGAEYGVRVIGDGQVLPITSISSGSVGPVHQRG